MFKCKPCVCAIYSTSIYVERECLYIKRLFVYLCVGIITNYHACVLIAPTIKCVGALYSGGRPTYRLQSITIIVSGAFHVQIGVSRALRQYKSNGCHFPKSRIIFPAGIPHISFVEKLRFVPWAT